MKISDSIPIFSVELRVLFLCGSELKIEWVLTFFMNFSTYFAFWDLYGQTQRGHSTEQIDGKQANLGRESKHGSKFIKLYSTLDLCPFQTKR